MEPVLQHVFEVLRNEYYCPDAIMLLQPTSPLRTVTHIDEALQKFNQGDFDSLISIFKIYNNRHEINEKDCLTPTFKKSENRDARPAVVFENGAIYISSVDLIKEGRIRGDKIGYYEMDQYSSFDIDEPRDLFAAEAILKIQNKL